MPSWAATRCRLSAGCSASPKRAITLGRGKCPHRARLRAMGPRAKAGRKYKVTTDSGHALPIAPNLLGQDFSCDASAESTSHAKAPDQVWLPDIAYLWTGEGWLYVCCVLDLFTRRIVGGSIEPHRTRERVLAALNMAYVKRRPPPQDSSSIRIAVASTPAPMCSRVLICHDAHRPTNPHQSGRSYQLAGGAVCTRLTRLVAGGSP